MARWGVDHGGLVVAELPERLEEEAVGGSFHEAHRGQLLVLGDLEPVGGAGLRVGVDERDGAFPPLAAAARYTEVVVLPTPPLSAATTAITAPT